MQRPREVPLFSTPKDKKDSNFSYLVSLARKWNNFTVTYTVSSFAVVAQNSSGSMQSAQQMAEEAARKRELRLLKNRYG
jgi:hypothetical protein